jgi:hypothetical protein
VGIPNTETSKGKKDSLKILFRGLSAGKNGAPHFPTDTLCYISLKAVNTVREMGAAVLKALEGGE